MRASIAQIVEQFKQSWCRELEDEAIRQPQRPPVVKLKMPARSSGSVPPSSTVNRSQRRQMPGIPSANKAS